MDSKKVLVLKGGWTSEREVSLITARGVENALTALGHQVIPYDLSRDLIAFITRVKEVEPDVIFNALHGAVGEDGTIQGVLEILGIPYTHCDVVSSALGMDKALSREIFDKYDIPTPQSVLTNKAELLQKNPMAFPYVIKPVADGSTVGISVIHSDEERIKAAQEWQYGAKILVEEFVPGRDLFVPIIDGKAIGIIEVIPNSGFYDYEAKYVDNKATHVVDPPLPPDQKEKALKYSEMAHQLLGCRSVTRTDFRYNPDGAGQLYMLEINTQPGMTPLSLVPEVAASVGISYNDLVDIILKGARCQSNQD